MTDDGSVIVVRGGEVRALLTGREKELIRTVKVAYEAHRDGESVLPHSSFLLFPGQPRDRIIALPGYLGGESNIAGIKWVSSFPGNVQHGVERASAVVILSSPLTGRPEAIIEGSVISAKRTAASAALAAECVLQGSEVTSVGLIGCGLINFEVARFLLEIFPTVSRLIVCDQVVGRAEQFRNKCRHTFGQTAVDTVTSAEDVLRSATLTSLATSASTPYINHVGECMPGSMLLHISLRDLTPDVILDCDNIVDDVDHVCRAETSIHLTEKLVGHRDFIRCTLGDILGSRAATRDNRKRVVVFSPFGLGILDLAVGKLVLDLASRDCLERRIDSFIPRPWQEDA